MNFFKGKSGEEESKGETGGLLSKIGAKAADKVSPNNSMCPSLSLKTRVKCWAACLCIGIVLALLSSSGIKAVAQGKVVKFAIFYTLGTIVGIASSMFLWGPAK